MQKITKAKTVYVALTAKAFTIINKKLNNDDLALVIDGLEIPTGHCWHDFRTVIDATLERSITDQLAKVILSVTEIEQRETLLAYANDFYNYLLLPLYKTLVNIQQALTLSNASNLVLVGPRATKATLPFWGAKSPETQRGSKYLFASYVAQIAYQFSKNVKITRIYTHRDLFCWEFLRRPLLYLANILLASIYIFRCLSFTKCKKISQFIDQKSPATTGETIVIARTVHQLRFANNLATAAKKINHQVSIFIVPQYLQNYQPLLEYILTENYYFTANIAEVIQSIMQGFVFAHKISKKNKQQLKSLKFNDSTFNISFSLYDLLREIRRFPIFFSYRCLLELILARRKKLAKIISFELVSRSAGMERNTATALKVPLETIQTAIIPHRPHVIFPFSNIFHCDSWENVNNLATIASVPGGTTVFNGSIYKVSVDSLTTLPKPQKISFFTQPNETIINQKIITKLINFANLHMAKILLRIHPRDKSSHYHHLLKHYPKLVSIDTSFTPLFAIANTDLCVVRTSSVAKEAIAMGKPIIACLWSYFDQQAPADYLQQVADIDHRAYNEEQLENLLIYGLPKLKQAIQKLQSKFFGDLSIDHLVVAICEQAYTLEHVT